MFDVISGSFAKFYGGGGVNAKSFSAAREGGELPLSLLYAITCTLRVSPSYIPLALINVDKTILQVTSVLV